MSKRRLVLVLIVGLVLFAADWGNNLLTEGRPEPIRTLVMSWLTVGVGALLCFTCLYWVARSSSSADGKFNGFSGRLIPVALDPTLAVSIRRIAGAILSFAMPHYGCCKHCGVPWGKLAKPHYIAVNMCGDRTVPFFALCETCWNDLDSEGRLLCCAMRYAELVVKGASEGCEFRHYEERDGRIVNIEYDELVKAVMGRDDDDEDSTDEHDLTDAA